jgi:cell division protein FtsW
MSTTEPRRVTPSIADRRRDMLHRLGLDEKHRMPLKPPTTAFYGILVVVSLFTALGLIMVLSSSSITSLHSGESAWRLFRRQTLWALVGVGAMWAVYKIPYQNWRRPKWLLPIILSSLLLNAVVPVVGRDINGARAWLQWGAFRLQPSEFMKIATIMYCAHYLTRRHRYVAVKEEVLKRMLIVMIVTCSLCVAQKDFGTSLVFASIILVMMLIIGVPMTQMAATVGLVGALGILVLTQADNASRRLLAFTDLEGTKSLDGYQVYQALLSIANGGLGGTGIGSGTSKWGYVPLAYSDFIFAVIAEELGMVGTVLVVAGFVALVYFGVQTALGARDMHGALLAGGISAWFAFQAIINIGGIIGVMPMTGLTLPFMSYGGSSLMATLVASGLLLNVARHVK